MTGLLRDGRLDGEHGAHPRSALVLGGIDEADGPVVQVGDPAGDGETQPRAAGLTAGLLSERAESFEDLLPALRRDAGALIGHLEPPFGGSRGPGHADRPVCRAVPRRVVEQVRDELPEPRRIALHGQVGRSRPDVEGDRLGADSGLRDGVLQQVGHADRLDGQRRHPSVDAGEVEQVLDQPTEPFGLVERRLQAGWVGFGDPVGQVLEQGAECGQRRPQLVRDVGDEVTSLAVDGGEVLSHRVERPSQLADLVAGARVHPPGVVAPRHLAGHLCHLPQGRRHADGEQLGDRQRHQDRHRDAEPWRDRTSDADGGDHGGHGHADRDQQPELHLDRRDPVERAGGCAHTDSRA